MARVEGQAAVTIDDIDDATAAAAFRTLVRHPDIANGLYDIHWLEHFLAGNPD